MVRERDRGRDRDREGAVLRKNIMLVEGKVCCQKVVTSSQVNEAKCNHDRDEMMRG